MSGDSLVSAADVARMAGVGRAAVSNWRRRYPDFPDPVDTGGSLPAFRLYEVEAWLRRQGKLRAAHPTDALWREIEAQERADADVVGDVATELRSPGAATDLAPAVRHALDDLADLPPDELIEALCARLFERQQRQHLATPEPISALMAELADLAEPLEGATVFNPACGPGSLLVAARRHGATRLVGQGMDSALVRIARIRTGGDIAEGDSLRADAFPGLDADAVLCDPPFGYREWGHDELRVDPRWEYGFPVKGEPELAWAQHCLAHVRPGGTVVLLVPAGVSGRRSGRPIRQALLRRGAVRAVFALPAGVLMSTGIAVHLWVLRNPEREGADPVLLVDTGRHQPQRRGQVDWPALREDVIGTWREYRTTGTVEAAAGVRRVKPAIDLLDEDVDLTPSRHLPPPAPAVDVSALDGARVQLVRRFEKLARLVPPMAAAEPGPRPVTTIGELARAGALSLRRQPSTLHLDERATAGPLVLTGRDVVAGEDPAARLTGAGEADVIPLLPGDLVVPLAATGLQRLAVRVIVADGWLLGPNLQLIRVAADRLDAHFVAGQIRAGGSHGTSSTVSGSRRIDVRRVEIPVVDLDEQQRLGALFHTLSEFERGLRDVAELGVALSGDLTEALAAGMIAPSR